MNIKGVAIFHCCLLLCISNCNNIQAQPLSGQWYAGKYESAQDTLLSRYSISRGSLLFADTSLGIAYWRYNVKDSLRGSGWRRTTDGGTTWHHFDITGIDGSSNTAKSRFSLHGANGLVIQLGPGNLMTPYLTSDSGHTWSPPRFPENPLYELVVDELGPSESHGVSTMAALHKNGQPLGFKRIDVSTDGGSSWVRLDSTLFVGLPDSVRSRYSPLDLHWIRDTVLTFMTGIIDTVTYYGYSPELWEVGIRGTILRRTPLPKDFSVLQNSPGTSTTRSIRFNDSVWMFLYRLSNSPQMSLTEDAGRTWRTIPQTQFQPYAAYYPSPIRIIQGNIISDDAGRTSRNWSSPYGVDGLFVIDSLHWTTSAGSIVAQTTDGGLTWNYKGGYRPITGLQAVGGTILLTSFTQRMLLSRDQGETFKDVTGGLPNSVTTITLLSMRHPDIPQQLAAVANLPSFESGVRQVLLHSNDTGATWKIIRDLTSLEHGVIRSLRFVPRRDGLGSVAWLTSDSTLSISTDGGATWTDRPWRFDMIDDSIGWSIDTAMIWRTTDGALTREPKFPVPLLYSPVASFKAFDELRAVAVLAKLFQTPVDWKIARTFDSGDTWETLGTSMIFPRNVSDFVWINTRDIYNIDGGAMWLSRDGGVNFRAETPDTSDWNEWEHDGRSIYFLGKGMFARWEITDPSISSVPNPNTPIASNRQLHVEATNGGITLYLGTGNEECDLEVHNVVGSLVQKQRVAKGNATIRIDNLLGGWYMLRLISQGRVVGSQGVVVLP